MKYAVNIADLTAYAHDALDPVMILLRPVLVTDPDKVIQVASDRFDEMATPIRDDLEEGRFEAIHQIIRQRIRKEGLRIYKSETGKGGWKRI